MKAFEPDKRARKSLGNRFFRLKQLRDMHLLIGTVALSAFISSGVFAAKVVF